MPLHVSTQSESPSPSPPSPHSPRATAATPAASETADGAAKRRRLHLRAGVAPLVVCAGDEADVPNDCAASTAHGFTCDVGRRARQEDVVRALPERGVYAVVDGHAGPDLARFLAARLGRCPSPALASPEAVAALLARVQDEWLTRPAAAAAADPAGCVATVLVQRRDRILLAHVGDTRAVLARWTRHHPDGCANRIAGCGNDFNSRTNRNADCGLSPSGCANRIAGCGNDFNSRTNRNADCGLSPSGCTNRIAGCGNDFNSRTNRNAGCRDSTDGRANQNVKGTICLQAVAVTRDHCASNPVEAARVLQAGGVILNGRVDGLLQVTRAFGALANSRPYLRPEPDISAMPLAPEMAFMVIASDGVWSVLSNQQAVDIASSVATPKEASDEIVQRARKAGARDNLSVLVVDFGFYAKISMGDDMQIPSFDSL